MFVKPIIPLTRNDKRAILRIEGDGLSVMCVGRWFFAFWLTVAFATACSAGGDNTPQTYNHFAFALGYQHSAGSYQWRVSAFQIDPLTGALTEAGTWPLSTTGYGYDRTLAVDPSRRHLYVAARGSPGDISAFAIDASSGALTQIPGSPFAAGESPHSIGFDQSGKFAYVLGSFSELTDRPGISVFSVNSSTGMLDAIPGSTVAVASLTSMAVDPSGRFIYAPGSSWDGTSVRHGISAFHIDTVTGALMEAAGSPFSVRTAPSSFGYGELTEIAVDPAGRFVVALAYITWNLKSFMIDAQTGALTEAELSPFNLPTYPRKVAVDPSGKFVFVVTDTDILAFKMDTATGALSEIAGWGSPSDLTSPKSIAFDPSGKFAYVSCVEGVGDYRYYIRPFLIDADTGWLTELSDSKLAVDLSIGEMTVIRIAR